MERWLAFRCRLFSACLARLVACAEFAKVLLLPVIRKTAYYADFAGNCQWLAGYSGLYPGYIHRKDAKGAKFLFLINNPRFSPGVCLRAGRQGFFI
jgi:hypothetical protein